MYTVFAILFFISVTLLILGLVSPKIISKFAKNPIYRHQAGIGFGLLTGIFLVLTGVFMPMHDPSETISSLNTPVTRVAQVQPRPQETATQKPITSTIVALQSVPFATETVQDAALPKGISIVAIKGATGIKTLTYEITTFEGKETARKLIKTELTQQPVNEVTKVGTKVIESSPTVSTPAPVVTSPIPPNPTSKGTSGNTVCSNKSGVIRTLLNNISGKTSSC